VRIDFLFPSRADAAPLSRRGVLVFSRTRYRSGFRCGCFVLAIFKRAGAFFCNAEGGLPNRGGFRGNVYVGAEPLQEPMDFFLATSMTPFPRHSEKLFFLSRTTCIIYSRDGWGIAESLLEMFSITLNDFPARSSFSVNLISLFQR